VRVRLVEAESIVSQSSSPVLLLSSPMHEPSAPVLDGKGVGVRPSAVLAGRFFDPSRKMEAKEGRRGEGFGAVNDEGA